jgi:hypothetical protein
MDWPCTRFISTIPPSVFWAGPANAVRFSGEPIDTRGFVAVRVVLTTGQGAGDDLNVGWELAEGWQAEGDDFRPVDSSRLVCFGDSRPGSVGWAWLILDDETVRPPFLRAELTPTGKGWIICGLSLELFAERPAWLDDPPALVGDLGRPLNDVLP